MFTTYVLKAVQMQPGTDLLLPLGYAGQGQQSYTQDVSTVK